MGKIWEANMLNGIKFSPKQVEILNCKTREIAIDGGRRFGKSFIAAALFCMWMAQAHLRMIGRVRRGEVAPWTGAGQPRKDARLCEPHIECVVLTPREKHQAQCRTYIRRYFQGTRSRFLHPDMASIDQGREMWWWYGGVARRVKFVTGSGQSAVVSNSLNILWCDEAGLLENLIMSTARPLLWEDPDYRLIASGTPGLGVEQWFSQMCLSGLDPSHEYYVPDVVDRDKNVTTVIGTSYDAFLPSVREAVKRDVVRLGSAWEAQWVKGDWRLPALFIYDTWDEAVHVVDYDWRTRKLPGRETPLPPPSMVIGVIDFAYSATNPGAAVVYHVWISNPLEEGGHPRPLVIAVDDVQEALEYTGRKNGHGWWNVIGDLRKKYRVQKWFCDPSRDEMFMAAKLAGKLIGLVQKASKADKWGRINLVKALLEATGGPPALYVNRHRGHDVDETGCANLPRQFGTYRRQISQSGVILNKTQDFDDHCLDCCAFLMGKIMVGGRPTLPTG